MGAWPQRKWSKRLPRLGQDVLIRLWRHVEAKSPAPRSRGQWTGVGDDALVRNYGRPLGLVGLGWSGQEPRVRLGLDGLLLRVGIGEGKRVVPMDVAVRRPDPLGPGGPCRDKRTWLPVMLDRPWAALRRRCRRWPAPLLVADSWLGDSGLMTPVALSQQGPLVVEAKASSVFHLPDGRGVKGKDVLTRVDWAWHDSAPLPGIRSARLTATSPTYGRVTVVVVDPPGRDRYDLLCRETAMRAPRWIRVWRRRRGMEQSFRTLKQLLAIDACQVPSEAAYDGHFILRLMAGVVLRSTARVVGKSRVTREALVFSVKPHWRFLASEMLE